MRFLKNSGVIRLLKLDIRTGRTHQIRVHMSYIKHPIVGDEMYGGKIVYRWQIEDKEAQPAGAVNGKTCSSRLAA